MYGGRKYFACSTSLTEGRSMKSYPMVTCACALVLNCGVTRVSTQSSSAATTQNDPGAASAVNPVPSSGRHLLDSSTTNDPNSAGAVNPVPSSSGRRLASITVPFDENAIDPIRHGRKLLECSAYKGKHWEAKERGNWEGVRNIHGPGPDDGSKPTTVR
ncbi:hypothetical protein WJX75_006205 [Coccomyxa subellipsoidea]|uniref:Uncharacterized protein n=1 Tax=Coccomyxa subellipsoidea TaxID=248742 RepID=A0ABR2YDB1_9CHLO